MTIEELEKGIEELKEGSAVAVICKAKAMAAPPEVRERIFNEIVHEDFESERSLLQVVYGDVLSGNFSREQLRPLCFVLGRLLAMDEGVDLFTSLLVIIDQLVVPTIKENRDLRITIENLTKAVEG